MTFEDLYKTRLALPESRTKDAIFSLKIEDIIIKPKDKMSIVEGYFKNHQNEPLNIVGKVVTEKMIFYHHIPKLIQKRAEFTLESLKIPEK